MSHSRLATNYFVSAVFSMRKGVLPLTRTACFSAKSVFNQLIQGRLET